MKIRSFELKKFRSIIKTEKLDLSNFNVLLGPNNEGKSNILQALVTILEYLTNPRYNELGPHNLSHYSIRQVKTREELSKVQTKVSGRFRLRRSSHYSHRDAERDYTEYIWKRDFPLKLQDANPNGKSEFGIRLELNKREKEILKSEGEPVNDILRINLDFSKEDWGLEAIDESTNKNLDKSKILRFLTTYLRIRYIDTVRTSATAKRIIQSTLEDELETITESTKYKQLMKKIEKLEQPVFKKLSKKLSYGAKLFLPRIKKIRLMPEEPTTDLESSPIIMVDDGEETRIEFKGDGIKSLLAISIIYESLKDSKNKNVVLAIEEPESHLHPSAIHALREVLMQLSLKNQVIITTHSPLLIDNYQIGNNILVDNSEASPAKSIADIRRILGVKLGDNLISARLVIITEGRHDSDILKSWISHSTKIKKAMEEQTIVFDELGGVTNLRTKVDMYKGIGVSVYPFLDKDTEGQNAEKTIGDLLLTVSFAGNSRQKESEIEDMVKEEIYSKYVKDNYNLDLTDKNFTRRNGKWSYRMKQLYLDNGGSDQSKDEMIKNLKGFISNQVKKVGKRALKAEYRPCINNFKQKIEKHLDGEIPIEKPKFVNAYQPKENLT